MSDFKFRGIASSIESDHSSILHGHMSERELEQVEFFSSCLLVSLYTSFFIWFLFSFPSLFVFFVVLLRSFVFFSVSRYFLLLLFLHSTVDVRCSSPLLGVFYFTSRSRAMTDFSLPRARMHIHRLPPRLPRLPVSPPQQIFKVQNDPT